MGNNIIPQQKLSKAQKTKSWGKSVIDELERISNTTVYNGRSSNYKKQIAYDLMNGKLNRTDFEYVLKPYGEDLGSYPANLQHYDIISPKIQLLLGEELKRPFKYAVTAVNNDAISELYEDKQKLVFQYLQSKVDEYYAEQKAILEQNAQQAGIPKDKMQQYLDQESQNIPKPKSLADLEKYFNTNYRSMREIQGQQLLDYLVLKDRLKEKFNLLFKDALVAGEEIAYTGLRGGQPSIRVCNPLDITVISDPDSPWIEDAIAVIEERWLHPATILDEFHDELTPAQVDYLEQQAGGGGHQSKDFEYHFETFQIRGEEDYLNSVKYSNTHRKDGTIRVIHCEWKSMRKIGFLISEDYEEIVGEEFRIPDHAVKNKEYWTWMDDDTEQELKLRWEWVSEVYEGTKIGTDVYFVQPKENQRRSLDNPSICKLGYVGYIHNARNSESVSLVDRMVPYQYLYDIIYYRTELAFAKNKGRIMLMDLAQIPTSQGWNVKEWLYYMETMNIAFINSFEQSPKGEKASFNQFNEIDLSMGNFINQHVMMLDKIEDKTGELSGVSRQRQGQVSSSELVGTTERAVVQSSHITEIYFYFHDQVKERCLTALLDCARFAYKKGTKLNYITEDLTRILINIEDNVYSETEFGVFIENNAENARIKSMAEEMAVNAYRAGSASSVEALTIMQHNSIAQMKRDLDILETKKKEYESQVAQQQSEAQMQAIKAEQEFTLLLDENETARNTQDNETKLEIARMQIEGQMSSMDMSAMSDQDKERRKEMLEGQKLRSQQASEAFKQSLALRKQQMDEKAKQKELEIKEKQANKKPTSK